MADVDLLHDLNKEATQLLVLAQLDIKLSQLRDAITAAGASAKTLADVVTAVGAGNTSLAEIATDTDKLDINLSALRDAVTGAGAAAKTIADVVTQLTTLNGKDFATQTTLAAVKTDLDTVVARLDITTSALRDALRGANSKTLTDLDTDLAGLQTTLSTVSSTLTSVKIDTGNIAASTATTATNTGNTSTNTGNTATNTAATATSTGNLSANFGAQADAAATTDAGTFSFVGLFKRLLQKFTTQFPAALTGAGNFKVAIQESAVSLGTVHQGTPNAGGANAWFVQTEDGKDVALGAIADAATTGDTAGSVSAKLRGLTKILGDVWSSANHWLLVKISSSLTTPVFITAGFVKDTNNSSTATLTAGSTFTGAATDISNYAGLTVNLFANPDMSPGAKLTFQFSPDGTNWDVAVPSTITNGNIYIPLPLRAVMQFFRLVYLNGSVNQSAFRLTTYLHATDPGPVYRTVTQTIQANDPAQLTRALIEPGLSPRSILSILSADRSVGGEAIVLPYIIQDMWQFDVPFANNNVTTPTSGGATATQSAAAGAVLTSANASGASRAQIVGLTKNRYKPGREYRTEFSTGYPAAGLANANVLRGLSDQPSTPTSGTANTIALGFVGTVFGLHFYSAGALTSIAKSAFNGDVGDGTGLSGFTSGGAPVAIDYTKANAFRIRGVWFGVGPVYLEIKSPDDIWVPLHALRYPNTATVPYIQSPNLYMFADVQKTASAGTGTLSCFQFCGDCGTVESELGFEPHEINGHKLVNTALAAQTASVTAWTVSTGRQLFIKSINLTVVNTSLLAAGQLEIRDATSGTGGTLLHAVSLQPATNQSNSGVTVPITMPVPLLALTGVRFVVVAGTLTFSFSLQGYEKEV